MDGDKTEKTLLVVESKAFESFFKNNYSRLYYFSLGFIQDEEVCKDIISDAFYFMWERLDTINMDTALSYMYTHVQRLCIDYIRRAKMKASNVEPYLHSLEKWSLMEHEESEDRINIIIGLIEKMSGSTRVVMEQCYLYKKTYREVAILLNISESGVRKHIMKGLSLIRVHFSVKYKKGSN